MLKYEELLLQNKAWAKEIKQADAGFFKRLAEPQKPEILWIGCSDSRVSPEEITQCSPGEIFMHRNIANLVLANDLNLFSVVQYAVQVLGVSDIVVCGHYDCGGVKAALGNQSFGKIDEWLENIKNIYREHKHAIDSVQDEGERIVQMIELNVKTQIMNLAQTDIIQNQWKKNNLPYLHGWVFDMPQGAIKQLIEISPNDALEAISLQKAG